MTFDAINCQLHIRKRGGIEILLLGVLGEGVGNALKFTGEFQIERTGHGGRFSLGRGTQELQFPGILGDEVHLLKRQAFKHVFGISKLQ